MLKRILVVLLVLGAMAPFGASAQSNAQTIEDLQRQIRVLMAQLAQLQGQSGNSQQCFFFSRNLGVGASGRDVRELHMALAREGFPVAGASQTFGTVEPRRALDDDSRSNDDDDDENRNEDKKIENENNRTDRYTEMTAAAVSSFQLKYREILTQNGLTAPTGYFGPSSRAKMNQLNGCSGIKPIETPTTPVIIYPTPMPPQGKNVTVTYPNGGESWLIGSAQSVRWLWSGGASTNLNVFLLPDDRISGRDWTLVSGVDSRNGTAGWSVIIPSVPTGQYKVAVCDTYMPNSSGFCDTSDSFFKIYANDTGGNLPPSISGVSGPTSLNVGQIDTWTVRASDPENGPLSYSVWWGDEATAGMVAASPATTSNVQQSATFTHSYARAGTFTPTFTVTDNSGQSARTSLSVRVGGGTNSTAIRVIYPNGDEVINAGSSLNARWSGGAPGSTVNIFLYDQRPDRYLSNSPMLIYSTANDGNQTVTIPAGLAQGPYRLGVSCQAGCAPGVVGNFDTSDGDFAVVSGGGLSSVQVLSPNGGETLEKGQVYRIKWESSGLSSVYIKLRKNSIGDTILGITNTIPNQGFYDWTVPTSLVNDNDYTIRVIGPSPSSPVVNDDSDAPFTITGAATPPTNPAPFINSITPNSGPVGTQISFSGTGISRHEISGIDFYQESPYAAYRVASYIDDTPLSFTIPSVLMTADAVPRSLPVNPGSYKIVVTKSDGLRTKSNVITFTVTGDQITVPVINSITPNSGPIGTRVTLSGTGFSESNAVTIRKIVSPLGLSYKHNLGVSPDGNGNLSFVIPARIATITEIMTGTTPGATVPGTYQILVNNGIIDSAPVDFTVTP